MINVEDAREWQRRRDLPGVEVRYMSDKRYSVVVISRCGELLGEKHDDIKRGKVVGTTFLLPKLRDE